MISLPVVEPGKAVQVPVIIMLLLTVMGSVVVKSDGGGGVGPALNVRGGIKGHYKTGIWGNTSLAGLMGLNWVNFRIRRAVKCGENYKVEMFQLSISV